MRSRMVPELSELQKSAACYLSQCPSLAQRCLLQPQATACCRFPIHSPHGFSLCVSDSMLAMEYVSVGIYEGKCILASLAIML